MLRGAATLDRGQIRIGPALHPTAIGLGGGVELGTRPLFFAFGVANLELSANVIHGDATDVALVGGYMQGLGFGLGELMLKNTMIVDGEVVVAHRFAPRLTLGARVGGGRQIVTGDSTTDFGFFALQNVDAVFAEGGLYGEWQLGGHDLLYAAADLQQPFVGADDQGDGTVNGLTPNDLRWKAQAGWTHVWKNTRFSAMVLHDRSMLATKTIPVQPMLDVWWTF